MKRRILINFQLKGNLISFHIVLVAAQIISFEQWIVQEVTLTQAKLIISK
jgi:hypothetical protein